MLIVDRADVKKALNAFNVQLRSTKYAIIQALY